MNPELSSLSQAAPPAPSELDADRDLQRRVELYLDRCHRAALRRLSLRVDDGELTIRGSVPTFHARQIALGVARRVDGVRRVIDAMEVA